MLLTRGTTDWEMAVAAEGDGWRDLISAFHDDTHDSLGSHLVLLDRHFMSNVIA